MFSLPGDTGTNLFSYVSQLIGDFKYPIFFFLGLLFLEFFFSWFASLWRHDEHETQTDKELNLAFAKTDASQSGVKMSKAQKRLAKKAIALEKNFQEVMKGEGVSVYTK